MHAVLAPSSAARWVACAGSVSLAARYPEEETQEARDGTAAHWGASEMLHGRTIDVGLVAPNGVALTDEMIEGAEMYVDEIDGALALYSLTRDALYVEERISVPDVHSLNWGTPDAWFYDPVRNWLVLFDFKFGHRHIEVFENWQLIDYACGVMSERLGIDGHTDQILHVGLCIVQPRSHHKDGPVRKWSTTGANLRQYINRLRNAAEMSQMPNAPCTPNDECDFCPGRHACEALQRAGYKAVELSGASVPVEMPTPALGLELRILQRAKSRLEARITGLEAQVLTHIKNGSLVPGYAVEQTVGRESWAKPPAEVVALGQMFGHDLSKPGVITPAQARKAGIPAEIVQEFSERPARGLKLVADDGTLARKVFGK